MIIGMTAFGGSVYVVFADGIEIYDSELLEPVGRLLIRGSQKLRDIAASTALRCLYVSDERRCCVYRVEIPGARGIFRWDVNGTPRGVAVSIMENVLVLNTSERKILEFSTFGVLVRAIDLKGDIQSPWNIAQMSTGEFAVTYGIEGKSESEGVSIVRAGSDKREDYKKLQSPRGVIIGPNNCVVVAVNMSNQVVVFDKTLSRQKVLDLQAIGGANSPDILCFDEHSDTLFYGEWKGQRLVSFGNAKNALEI